MIVNWFYASFLPFSLFLIFFGLFFLQNSKMERYSKEFQQSTYLKQNAEFYAKTDDLLMYPVWLILLIDTIFNATQCMTITHSL
jgi:hypothetical protein